MHSLGPILMQKTGIFFFGKFSKNLHIFKNRLYLRNKKIFSQMTIGKKIKHTIENAMNKMRYLGPHKIASSKSQPKTNRLFRKKYGPKFNFFKERIWRIRSSGVMAYMTSPNPTSWRIAGCNLAYRLHKYTLLEGTQVHPWCTWKPTPIRTDAATRIINNVMILHGNHQEHMEDMKEHTSMQKMITNLHKYE